MNMTANYSDDELPLVSVLMPVYNAAQYLQESIDSILGQTYTRLELLILNDGSSDESVVISQAAARRDPRIRFFDGPNQGLVHQLNKGLQEAGGQYIARMDADDIAHSERLERQLAYLEAHPKVGLCGTAVRYIGASQAIIYLPETNEEIRNTLWLQNAFYHPTVVIRTSVVAKHSLRYNPAYDCAEDYKLWSELSAVTETHNLPEVLLDYRIHPQQVSRRKSVIQQQIVARIRHEQMTRLGIILRPDQQAAFKLLTIDDRWGQLQPDDYETVAALLNDLLKQARVIGLHLPTVQQILAQQWMRILEASRQYWPALIISVLRQPLRKYIAPMRLLKLITKCLISWKVKQST
jgi:glycosyltransferase involved in cell wall biosynthesis